MNGVKYFVSILLSCMFVTSTSASGLDDDMLLAQRSGGNNNSSRTESSSRSSEERPSRPKVERPSRPSEPNHTESHSEHKEHHEPPHHHDDHHNVHHHDEPPHHHHHHHDVPPHHYYEEPTVVIVEEEPVYVSTASAPSQIVSGDYDIDPVMVFVSLGGGVSFRGVTGVHPYGNDEVESDGVITTWKSLGYNVEAMCEIGLSKHSYLSAGVGFSKQSIANKFFPGNYMYNTKHILDMPLYIGHRKSSEPGSFASISGGPRFVYGIEGKCKEYYDFYPVPESGIFEHDCYDGEYGKKRFSVGLGFEIQIVSERVMVGFDFNIYPRTECEPRELYDGLYREFRRCRKNATIKIGCRVL